MVEPVGLLMWEHRLIEKIVPSIKEEIDKVNKTGEIDANYIETIVDFFKIYADKTHHGKEENILFEQLNQKKNLQDDHKRIMNELIQEHTTARYKVKQLIDLNNAYRKDKSQLDHIVTLLSELSSFYPEHIEKEDKHFFIPVMEYFTQEERQEMLKEFEKFDMAMIHWKYQQVVKVLTGVIVPIRYEP